MTTVTKMKREDVLRLKVSPDIKSRLERLSGLLGMPPSTLAAFAIGMWITQQENAFSMLDKMADRVGFHLGDVAAAQLRQELNGDGVVKD